MPANTEHPEIQSLQPDDPNVKVWRYVSLPALIDMLSSSSLYFARADTLDDPFEGSIMGLNKLTLSGSIGLYKRVFIGARRVFYVNCWCVHDTESVAMWGLYGSHIGSVAIQSTYAKLVAALNSDVLIGRVQYKDYSRTDDAIPTGTSIPGVNLIPLYMHKRLEFQHETEARCLLLSDSESIGEKVSIEVESIVEKIIVHPRSPDWIHASVEAVVSKFGYSVPVSRSGVDRQPIF